MLDTCEKCKGTDYWKNPFSVYPKEFEVSVYSRCYHGSFLVGEATAGKGITVISDNIETNDIKPKNNLYNSIILGDVGINRHLVMLERVIDSFNEERNVMILTPKPEEFKLWNLVHKLEKVIPMYMGYETIAGLSRKIFANEHMLSLAVQESVVHTPDNKWNSPGDIFHEVIAFRELNGPKSLSIFLDYRVMHNKFMDLYLRNMRGLEVCLNGEMDGIELYHVAPFTPKFGFIDEIDFIGISKHVESVYISDMKVVGME